MTAYQVLRQFARRDAPSERCELCGSGLDPEHDHMVEPAAHRLLCACRPCAILFGAQQEQRYKRVPSRVRVLSDFHLTAAHWDSLLVPINMAFFFRRSSGAAKVIAVYPSPAGATESQLALEAWDEIAAANPELQSMEEDVEALLVNRLGPEHHYLIVPIDHCFKLVGIVRAKWSGLSGGSELWDAIGAFFDAEQRYA